MCNIEQVLFSFKKNQQYSGKTYCQEVFVGVVEGGDGSFTDELGVKDFGDQDVGSLSHVGVRPDSDGRRTLPDESDLVPTPVQSHYFLSARRHRRKLL